MSEPTDKKKSRRKSGGSSLADAVVAALAQAERRDPSLPPDAGGGASTPQAVVPTAAAALVPAAVAASAVAPATSPSAASAAVVATVQRAVAVPLGDSDDPVITTHAEPIVTTDPNATTDSNATAEPSAARDTAAASADAPSAPGHADVDGPATARREAAKIETISTAAEGIQVRYFGRTDVGLVREHNEDNFMVADLTATRRGVEQAILETRIAERGCVFCVCDGMGGAAAGEVASQMAVDTIYEIMQGVQGGSVPKDRDGFARRLVNSIEEAGSRIFGAAKMDRTRRGMGTTSTVAGLLDGTLFVGQVGDSRAYVLRGDQFALISKDQSLVNQLIEAGQLTEDEAEAFEHSNIILQALGTTEEVVVDLTFLELRRGDRLLLCSDGLSGLVHIDMIKEVLIAQRDLTEAAAQLISMANAGGGHDNITVVLCDFDGETLKPSTPEARVAYQQYPLPPEVKSDASPTPRPTHIKSGGPKPGADVKGEPSARRSAAQPSERGGRGWAPLVVIGVLLLLVAAAVLYGSSGAGSAPDGAPSDGRPSDRRPSTSAPAPRRERIAEVAPARATLVVNAPDSTDEPAATLWVNDVVAGTATSGRELRLDPGVYHVRATAGAGPGAALVAEATVTLEPGDRTTVDLSPRELSDGESGDERSAPSEPSPAATLEPGPPLGGPAPAPVP